MKKTVVALLLAAAAPLLSFIAQKLRKPSKSWGKPVLLYQRRSMSRIFTFSGVAGSLRPSGNSTASPKAFLWINGYYLEKYIITKPLVSTLASVNVVNLREDQSGSGF